MMERLIVKKIGAVSLLSLLFLLMALTPVQAQEEGSDVNSAIQSQVTFKARIVKVTDETAAKEPGVAGSIKRQLFQIVGLSGKYKNMVLDIDTADFPDALVKNEYRAGEEVIVMYSVDDQGKGIYAITDYVRTNVILWLFAAFVISVIAIGRFKGFRSILSLVLTFLVMVKYIVPQIIGGANPVLVTVIGSIAILISIIYVTEGFNARSNISAASIFICLLATIFLSWLLVGAAKLTGLTNEEAGFIINLGKQTLNLKGILLAGIIIGTLGALDDIVISQVVTVFELNAANDKQTRTEILVKAFNVGVSHISAMTNTLFLAYSGAALPLLILFVSGQSSFSGWDVAINNEMLATEIIRTLAGTIGIVLSVPISTLIAVWYVKREAL
jgi:uncharacterized membrane protein